MKKVLIFLLFFLASVFLTSQVSAFFGCAIPPRPENYGSILVEGEVYHLHICGFTPNDHVRAMLHDHGIAYEDGELVAAYNIKLVGGKPKVYVGENSMENIVAYLKEPPIKDWPAYTQYSIQTTISQARRVAGMLNTFALFMEEDYLTHITHAATRATFSLDWNGIVSGGSLEVPRYYAGRDNIMNVGQLLTEDYFEEEYYFSTQPEFRISGIGLKFAGIDKRSLKWLQEDSFLARYSASGELLERYVATPGTTAVYNVRTKRLGQVSRGTLYLNGEAIKGADLSFAEKETQLCCATNPDYCIPVESKTYALDLLNTDCDFGIGEFDIDYNKGAKETKVSGKDTELVYNMDADTIKKLVS
ncbi:MAG: hypothetical protein K6T16_01805 [Candidatus Pacearchaeota archaeon]|nr:hypothetical protein [Candidatus Pacearchaeota archaeon]